MGKDGAQVHGVTMSGRDRVLRLLGLVAATAIGCSSPTSAEPPGGMVLDRPRLPDPVPPAFAADDVAPLVSERWEAVWAVIGRPVAVRALPARTAPVVGHLSTLTPEGTDNIVQTIDRTTGRHELWVEVRFPSLPNGAEGWIPRGAIGGYGVVRTRLVVDLSATRARLFRRGRLVFDAPVGIGRPRWPTPTGRFYIRNRLKGFGEPFYGPVAFGTSARSAVLTDWPASGFVGIHGTNRPDLIPGAVSHGCIRLRNRDVVRLNRLMPIGTPVTIRR